jgi:hypothetical protein
VVFIGPESSECSFLRVYVLYYYIVVQRLSHMSRYYPAVNPKSSVHSVLLGIRSLYYL